MSEGQIESSSNYGKQLREEMVAVPVELVQAAVGNKAQLHKIVDQDMNRYVQPAQYNKITLYRKVMSGETL